MKLKYTIILFPALLFSSAFYSYFNRLSEEEEIRAALVDRGIEELSLAIKDYGNGVNIGKKIIKTANEEIGIDMEIPIIEGIDESFYNEINKKIEEDLITFKYEIEEMARENRILSLGNEEEDRQYKINSRFRVPYNDGNILSIIVITYNSDGEYGDYMVRSYNFDLDKGTELKIKDVFNENKKYEEEINNLIKNEINRDPEAFFKEERGFNSIISNQPFCFNKGGITILFQMNYIAPITTGIPEFNIDKESIYDFLKDEYKGI